MRFEHSVCRGSPMIYIADLLIYSSPSLKYFFLVNMIVIDLVKNGRYISALYFERECCFLRKLC